MIYIIQSVPFIDDSYNFVEIFNEATIILFTYAMIGCQSRSLLTGVEQWYGGYLVVALIISIFLVNLGVGARRAVGHLKQWLAKRKAKNQSATKSTTSPKPPKRKISLTVERDI